VEINWLRLVYHWGIKLRMDLYMLFAFTMINARQPLSAGNNLDLKFLLHLTIIPEEPLKLPLLILDIMIRLSDGPNWPVWLVITHLSQYFGSVAVQVLTLFFYFIQFFLDLGHRWIAPLLFLLYRFLEVKLHVLDVFFYCINIFLVLLINLFYWLTFFNRFFTNHRWSWSLGSFLGRCWSFPKLFTITFILPQFWIGSFWLLFDPILSILCILLNNFLNNSSGLDKIIEACHPHSPLLKSGCEECKSSCGGLHKKWVLKLFGAHLDHLLLDWCLG